MVHNHVNQGVAVYSFPRNICKMELVQLNKTADNFLWYRKIYVATVYASHVQPCTKR